MSEREKLYRAPWRALLLPENLSQKKLDALTVVSYPAHLIRPPCFPLLVYAFERTQASQSCAQSTLEVFLS